MAPGGISLAVWATHFETLYFQHANSIIIEQVSSPVHVSLLDKDIRMEGTLGYLIGALLGTLFQNGSLALEIAEAVYI